MVLQTGVKVAVATRGRGRTKTMISSARRPQRQRLATTLFLSVFVAAQQDDDTSIYKCEGGHLPKDSSHILKERKHFESSFFSSLWENLEPKIQKRYSLLSPTQLGPAQRSVVPSSHLQLEARQLPPL